MTSIKKEISIIGSTGSIGTQALDIIKAFPDKFKLYGISGGNNADLLYEQILTFNPTIACIKDKSTWEKLYQKLKNTSSKTNLVYGEIGLKEITNKQQDLIIIAISGTSGIQPTYDAIQAKSPIGLACKEVLVSAGTIIMNLAKKLKVPILPIDSEHAAIHQCLAGISNYQKNIHKITLTASGGPFWSLEKKYFKKITPESALNHPKWSMGKKISIDSATLVNKGLEVIEAHHLFNIPLTQCDVLIHRQSLVHGIAEFIDGNVLAHLSPTDMRFPIQYVMTYPNKVSTPYKRFKFTDFKTLTFEEPNHKKFPLLNIAIESGKKGGTYPVVFNAANEAAVYQFLNERITFLDIEKTIVNALENTNHKANPSIQEIIELDQKIKSSIPYGN